MSKHHHHGPRETPKQTEKEAEAGLDGAGTDSAGAEVPFEEKNAAVPPSAGGEGDSNAECPEELSPERKIAELEAKLAEANDNFLRKAADFENFRKRMNREKQEAIDFANQSLLLDLIPVMDDFDRALKAARPQAEHPAQTADGVEACAQQPAGDFAGLYEGIAMIEKRLSSQLETKWGLKRFDSEGEPFDPNRHEALMMEKSPELTEPVVKEDFLKGYTLKDRVVRSAKVKVLMPEEKAAAKAENSPTEA
jgi:molecular chaperone GrpE